MINIMKSHIKADDDWARAHQNHPDRTWTWVSEADVQWGGLGRAFSNDGRFALGNSDIEVAVLFVETMDDDGNIWYDVTTHYRIRDPFADALNVIPGNDFTSTYVGWFDFDNGEPFMMMWDYVESKIRVR